MLENFITAFVVYFVVIDPIGNSPIFLAISFSAFKIASGIILLLVTIDMLSNRRQQRKEQGGDRISPEENVSIFPMAIPLPAGPAAITSVMVVSSCSTGSLKLSLLGLGALAAVMAITAVILIAISLAEAYLNARVPSVFSRITAIILAALSIQYIIDGLQTLDGLPIS